MDARTCSALWGVLLMHGLGCAGVEQNRHAVCTAPPRVTLCQDGEVRRPEAVGVWRWTSGQDDYSIVYDGCTVRFADNLYGDPAVFTGWRNIADAFVVDVHDYADPFPYFRARARWEGAALLDDSILDNAYARARWDGTRFRTPRGDAPMRRVSPCAQLTAFETALIGTTTVIPTEAELAAQRSVEVPEHRPPRDLMQEMLCPDPAECVAPDGEAGAASTASETSPAE